jgi:hypothetical protein
MDKERLPSTQMKLDELPCSFDVDDLAAAELSRESAGGRAAEYLVAKQLHSDDSFAANQSHQMIYDVSDLRHLWHEFVRCQ